MERLQKLRQLQEEMKRLAQLQAMKNSALYPPVPTDRSSGAILMMFASWSYTSNHQY